MSQLAEDVGYIKGKVEVMEKALTNITEKVDKHSLFLAKLSLVAGVLAIVVYALISVGTNILANSLK